MLSFYRNIYIRASRQSLQSYELSYFKLSMNLGIGHFYKIINKKKTFSFIKKQQLKITSQSFSAGMRELTRVLTKIVTYHRYIELKVLSGADLGSCPYLIFTW